jgi:FHA domain/Domain of unknown function (DUF1707)
MRMQQGPGEASTPPAPLRASDAERDQVVGELRERFAEGRLSQDSFVWRVDAALRARERHELAGLLADMPASRRLADALTGVIAGAISGTAARWQAAARRAAGRWQAGGQPAPGWPELPFPAGSELWFTIGRDSGCDLVLANITVSRCHARLERDGDGWLLQDLGSTNGTRINGWLVSSPAPVRAGDQVSFGAAGFVLADG